MSLSEALNHAASNQQRHLDELIEFLRIPSVSTQPERADDVKEAAGWLAAALERAGLENVQVIPTGRHPMVYGDWLHAGENAPTVLIYGHYDVQPAEPLDLWESPPFEPDIRDEYIYARGSSDDKGQVYIHVKAVESYLQTSGRLPVNIRFIIEGEEEIGSDSLSAFVPENREMLAADTVVISDTAMIGKMRPTIVYGLRGMCYIMMDITGPGRDLHSGSYGGGVNNPINALARILARLQDDEGHILIPGFYDKVRPLSERERKILSAFPLDEAAWMEEAGVAQAWGEPEYTLVERLGARPTLDINGIVGGYTGAGSKTVLPSHAHAKVSMRLVPDQDPEEIRRLFVDYVNSLVPPGVRVRYTFRGGGAASVTSLETPAVKAAVVASQRVFGLEPVFMREGGSIPIVGQFQQELGADPVLLGFGLLSDNIHAPNERFYVPHYFKGIETIIRFLAEYG